MPINIKNRIRGKQNKKTGQRGEEIAERFLKTLGFLHIEPMETGWTIQWRNGKPYNAFPKKKVSGDFHAMEPGTARYVHVETKTRQADRLPWSAFESHQTDKMNQKAKDGALVLVVWVRSPVEIKCVQWPVVGFGPRKSIRWENIK